MRNQRSSSSYSEDSSTPRRRTPARRTTTRRTGGDTTRATRANVLRGKLRKMEELLEDGFEVVRVTEEDYYSRLLIIGTAEDFEAMGLPAVEDSSVDQREWTQEEWTQHYSSLTEDSSAASSTQEESSVEDIPEDAVEEQKSSIPAQRTPPRIRWL